MPTYSYKAIAENGRAARGQIEAFNIDDLEMRLRRMQLDFVSGRELRQWGRFSASKIPRREMMVFCFHLEQLVRAQVPLIDGLSDLRDSLEAPRFRSVIAKLIEAIEGGQTLSQAMEQQGKIFDAVFVSLIRSGEASGCLADVLNGLSESLKWEDELAAQTKKLLIYPVFVGSIVMTATFFLMIYMVPQLKQFIKNMGQTLPLQTQILFYVSDALVAYWHLVLSLPMLLLVGLKVLLHLDPQMRLRLDALKLNIPLIGNILRKIILSRFANTFALLYSAKIPIIEATRITQGIVGNLVIEQALQRVTQLIAEGQNITSAFESTRLFPPLVVRMLRIGESTGALDKALLNVSYFYNRDVKESVEKVQQLIEPMLTLILGVLLGWIMLSVLGPVYDVISNIKT